MNDMMKNTLPDRDETQMPMKWHKFLIYFSLFASAVINAINAATYFTGTLYGGDAAMVYAFYDGLSLVDKGMALGCIALAVFSILTRNALAGYRENGPGMLTGVYAANLGLNVAYLLIASAVTQISLGELIDSSTISSLITTVVMIFVNKTYYNNRRHLFTN